MPDGIVERVLMTADTVGGVWTFALELSKGLHACGVQVLLAALGGEPNPHQRAEAEAIPNLQLRTSGYKLEWMDDPWRDVEESGEWLLDLADEFRPDVVHLNTFGHGGLAWDAPVVLTAHSCVVSWWAAVRGGPLPVEWDRYRREVKNSLQAVDLVTAPSRSMMRSLERNYGVALPNPRVIPNGRSPERYRPQAKEPLILTAGRLWDEGKNAALVARAARQLPDWQVCLAGESRDANGSPMEPWGCRLLGPLSSDALASWYGRAAIYALPARYEPFGLSVLEAALSGCALVLGDIESLREIWQDAAVYVSPDDENALVAALRELIGNRDRREQLARRSRERALAFPPARMVQEYAEAYAVTASRRTACVS